MYNEHLTQEPFDTYINHPTAWGSSQARKALTSSRNAQDWREGRASFPGSAACDLGNAWETLVTEGWEELYKLCAVKPNGLDMRTKEGKAWREEHAGKNVLDESSKHSLTYMHERLDQQFKARIEVAKRLNRFQLVGRASVGPLLAQCRIDMLEDKHMLDFKTTGRNLEHFARHAFDLGYHIQAGWYRLVLTHMGLCPLPMHFLVTETIAPWRTAEFVPDSDWTARADADAALCAQRIAANLGREIWEDETPTTFTLALPAFAGREHQPTFEA